MAKPKTPKSKPLDRWIAFLREEPAVTVGKKIVRTEPAVAAVFALAKKNDARVHAFMEALCEEPTSFCVYDLEVYPEMFLRGKKGEPWNAGEKVVAADDVCLGRNGGGDLHVWNAKTGKVRFLVHDEDWRVSRTSKTIDDWVEDAMNSVVELAGTDQLDDADDEYVARLRLAIAVAGSDSLDDDVREALAERE